MTRVLRTLLLTSEPELETQLSRSLADNGLELVTVDDLGAAVILARQGDVNAAVADLRTDPEDPAGLCRSLRNALPPGAPLVALLPHDSRSEVQRLFEHGATEVLSTPSHPGLIALKLSTLCKADLQLASHATPEGRDFLDRDGLSRELTRRIPIVRSANRHLAMLCIRLHADRAEFDWVGLEADERGAVERHLLHALDAVCEEFSASGPARSDMRLSWQRPDTMMLLVGGLDRVQDVAKLGGRMQELIQRPLKSGGLSLELHSSVGIATCPGDGVDIPTVLEACQVAAERARQEGRNSLSFHNPSMGQWAFERLTLEQSLSDAIRNNELRVYYQPRVDINTREILGMEALVRWVHPQLGMVSPGQFIPLAEETGLISPIGEWVLEESCRQNREWRDAGLRPIRVSVNLSPVQFRNPNLHERVCAVIERTGLPKDGLELEVTESMLMNDPKVTIGTLRKLKAEGLKISIDDFGTGYSSLSYLKQFPIDSLKIDRSFVRDVTTNPDDAAIATAIILMGHSLRLNVVAEGVETESQLAFLCVLQCNEIQGFLFSPPVPADKATVLLSSDAPMRAIG